MDLKDVRVIKKDGTKEEFNVQKVVVAVNKSAYRALIQFTEEDIQFICRFVEEKVLELGVKEIQIAQMHNVVEGALDHVSPAQALGRHWLIVHPLSLKKAPAPWSMTYLRRLSSLPLPEEMRHSYHQL